MMIVCGFWQKIQTAVLYVFIAITFAFLVLGPGVPSKPFDTTRPIVLLRPYPQGGGLAPSPPPKAILT